MPAQNATDGQGFVASFHRKTTDLPRQEWNALLQAEDPPFLDHGFLTLLETTRCVGEHSGWEPFHLCLRSKADHKIAALVPMYLKYHSYGEYVFDWSWANAYHQHGLKYYPKLVIAVPFTPVNCRKLLTADRADKTGVVDAAFNALGSLCEKNPVSSIHALFLPKADNQAFVDHGFLPRIDNQFHWHNQDYHSFDDFLARFTAKKRKNIRQERIRVAAAGVEFRWLSGGESRESDWLEMYRSYVSTVSEHGGMPYLSEAFFLELAQTMGNRVHLLQGRIEGKTICSALFFSSATSLYGRYWGADRFIPCLHFETCYYQPIEYAIQHGLNVFEAGAQGGHKLSRGLEPTKTRSAHWLKHEEFYQAIGRYLESERQDQDEYHAHLRDARPFKTHAGEE